MLIKWIKEREGRKERKKGIMTESQTGKTIYLDESIEPLSNPGCGWYHLYSFDLSEESFLYIACEEEALVLLRIDIHAFRSCEQIPKEALDWADRIITFFAQHGKGIILRIVYDTDGHGMEHEPSSAAFVKSHMKQLGAVIKSHAGEILVHQGLFVGSWGEMHGSKFLMGGRMEELAMTLAQAIDGTCPIAVRKPVQLRMLRSLNNKLSVSSAFTLFNDGIFGSETDLGTYGTVAGNDRKAQLETTQQDETQAWSRQDELVWQQKQMQRSFCGGEALGGMTINVAQTKTDRPISTLDWHQAAAELAKMHVSYLNSTYRKELLDDWKAQRAVWNGEKMSGYDYIGRHLGYRFAVVKVNIGKKKQAQHNKPSRQLQITIRNTGFANLCEEAVCKVVLVETNEEKEDSFQSFEIACDPRTWDSGTDTTIECTIPKGTFRAYLQLTRKRDGHILAFANEEYDCQFGAFLVSFDSF